MKKMECIREVNIENLYKCFSFWDFEQNSEKRERIKHEIVAKKRVMYAYILNDEYIAGMSLQPLENNIAYLSYLAVKDEFRNQGIGTKMIHYACDVSRENGFSYLTLNVDIDNRGAEKLYRRLGFRAVGFPVSRRIEMRKCIKESENA